jgi:hypothetical protein
MNPRTDVAPGAGQAVLTIRNESASAINIYFVPKNPDLPVTLKTRIDPRGQSEWAVAPGQVYTISDLSGKCMANIRAPSQDAVFLLEN